MRSSKQGVWAEDKKHSRALSPGTMWVGVDNKAAVEVLSALGFGTRLDAIILLAEKGADGLAAGELAQRLGIPQNTLSGHIQCLARADLVTAERQSRTIIYRINSDVISALVAFLDSPKISGRAEH